MWDGGRWLRLHHPQIHTQSWRGELSNARVAPDTPSPWVLGGPWGQAAPEVTLVCPDGSERPWGRSGQGIVARGRGSAARPYSHLKPGFLMQVSQVRCWEESINFSRTCKIKEEVVFLPWVLGGRARACPLPHPLPQHRVRQRGPSRKVSFRLPPSPWRDNLESSSPLAALSTGPRDPGHQGLFPGVDREALSPLVPTLAAARLRLLCLPRLRSL